MIFVHDTRDKPSKHKNVTEHLLSQGHQIVRSKLFVGDISFLNDQSVCIDLKRNLSEICLNVCQQHSRFRAELIRANEYGIKLVILCEHGRDIKCLNDVIGWVNPRIKESPMAVSGERLYKILSVISVKYSVDFLFCTKAETGKRIIELLTEESK